MRAHPIPPSHRTYCSPRLPKARWNRLYPSRRKPGSNWLRLFPRRVALTAATTRNASDALVLSITPSATELSAQGGNQPSLLRHIGAVIGARDSRGRSSTCVFDDAAKRINNRQWFG